MMKHEVILWSQDDDVMLVDEIDELQVVAVADDDIHVVVHDDDDDEQDEIDDDEVDVQDENDDDDFVASDDEVLGLVKEQIEQQQIDDEQHVAMLPTIDDEVEDEVISPIIDNDANELCLYSIQQTEVIELVLHHDDNVVILVTDAVCIDLQVTEHLIL